MTGVEAVSNGVSAFREPKVRQAHGTLAAIVFILALLLLGIAHLARAYGVMAMDQTLRSEWQDCVEEPARRLGLRPPGLEFVKSDFRSMTAPLLRTVRDAGSPGNCNPARTDRRAVVGLPYAHQS
jgi:hypothetical protein